MPKYPNDTYFGAVAKTHDYAVVPGTTPATVFTAAPVVPDLTNLSARGVRVVLDITVNAGSSAAVTVTIKGKDPVSGKYYTLLASAAKSAPGTYVFVVYPTITAAANTIAQDVLPQTFQVVPTHADANPVTYTIGASLLP